MSFVCLLLLLGCYSALGSQAHVAAQFARPQTIDLDAVPLSSTSVQLRWRVNNPVVVRGIHIYRAHPVEPDNFTLLVKLPANALTYIDTSVKPGSTWIYCVRTQGTTAAILSAPSNAAKITTPENESPAGSDLASNTGTGSGNGGPTFTTTDPTMHTDVQTLIARAISANQIELKWAVPTLAHVAALQVYRASSAAPKNFLWYTAVDVNAGRFVDNNLKPKTTYYYYVRYKYNSTGAVLSSPSNTASATTPDGPQPDIRGQAAANRPKPGILFDLMPMGTAIPLDPYEEEALYVINQYRAAKGLGPVRASIALTQSADDLARELADTGVVSKSNASGLGPEMRARAYGFYDPEQKYDSIVTLTKAYNLEIMTEVLRFSGEDYSVLLDPRWKVVGIGSATSGGTTVWVMDFCSTWDKTLPLPGEDTDGRIDGNERVRTRPPIDALQMHAVFTGYGDDGKPYSPVHCDVETKECWRDPAPAGNRALRQRSLPEYMIGDWHVERQISAKGVVHSNDLELHYDMTEFAMSLRINKDGTWIAQGYKANTSPVSEEVGTWKSVHDIARSEELVTFYRADGRPSATIRVHAVPGTLTLFAVDGGTGFFKNVPADTNHADDAQVIFAPGLAKFDTPFPAALRCLNCPLP